MLFNTTVFSFIELNFAVLKIITLNMMFYFILGVSLSLFYFTLFFFTFLYF